MLKILQVLCFNFVTFSFFYVNKTLKQLFNLTKKKVRPVKILAGQIKIIVANKPPGKFPECNLK